MISSIEDSRIHIIRNAEDLNDFWTQVGGTGVGIHHGDYHGYETPFVIVENIIADDDISLVAIQQEVILEIWWNLRGITGDPVPVKDRAKLTVKEIDGNWWLCTPKGEPLPVSNFCCPRGFWEWLSELIGIPIDYFPEDKGSNSSPLISPDDESVW